MFWGHLDKKNLRETGSDLPLWNRLGRQAGQRGVPLKFKTHLLSFERTENTLDFGVVYQGATTSQEPNYTGITVIDSWYSIPD